MNKTRENLGFFGWHLFCQDALEVTGRTGRIVVRRRLGTLGLAHSLLCGEKRCENDTQSFSLSFQI